MNKDKWTIKKDPCPDEPLYAIGVEDDTGFYLTAKCFSDGEGELICAAVNACKRINPDNPLAVAENIEELVKAITAWEGSPLGEMAVFEAYDKIKGENT